MATPRRATAPRANTRCTIAAWFTGFPDAAPGVTASARNSTDGAAGMSASHGITLPLVDSPRCSASSLSAPVSCSPAAKPDMKRPKDARPCRSIKARVSASGPSAPPRVSASSRSASSATMAARFRTSTSRYSVVSFSASDRISSVMPSSGSPAISDSRARISDARSCNFCAVVIGPIVTPDASATIGTIRTLRDSALV